MKIAVNVTESSHADHLARPLLDEVLAKLARGESTQKVFVPGALAIAEVSVSVSVPCALRGPITDGQPIREGAAFYGVRGAGRPNLSRMTTLPATESTTATVIVVKLEGEGETFSGQLATACRGTGYRTFDDVCSCACGDAVRTEETGRQ